jgi:putative ABC transport system permease protein
MTAFAARMAWRETRAAWRHWLAALAAIALGVAAVVGVGSVAANLDRTMAREAKALMGGDLEVRSVRPLPHDLEARLGRLGAQGAALSQVRELVAMARHPTGGETALVELKAVDAAYPLYGRLDVTPGRPLAELVGGGGALVEGSLLARLRLQVGDGVLVGTSRLTITGVVRREPDRAAGLVTLGPRILVDQGALDRTGLIQRGSRVRYRTLVRLPEGLDARATRESVARDLAEPAVRVTTAEEAQPGLRRFLGQLTTYLGLVGLVSLLVGGIGVAASARAFVRRKLFTVAVLRCLGADSRGLLTAYLLQTGALGALASAAGGGLGLAAEALALRLLTGLVPFEVEARLAPDALGRGLAMGVATTLLATLWPLREIRDVKPARILRVPVEPVRGSRRSWRPVLVVVPGLAALVLWQAGSLGVGAIVLGASAAALLALWGAGRGLVALAGRRRGLTWLPLRHGIASLRRPGHEAVGIVVALGLGVMLVVAVSLLERSLGRQLDLERRREVPSFFFIDIQPDQADAFAGTVATVGGSPPALTPVVRSRLAAVNGQPIDRLRSPSGQDPWYLIREYVLTFADAPPATNVVTAGRWWTPAEAAGRPRVSVEDSVARLLGVDVGGTLAFDIQGVRVEGEVMSLRKVDWQSLSTNFFVIFSPGALDGAPTSYIATARVPAAGESAVQSAVAGAFPNVTAIPVRDILERVTGVMDRIAVAVRGTAFFVVAAGGVVMAGALATTRAQRLTESVILRTLGASRWTVAGTFAVEYACLGTAAGAVGAALAGVLAWVVLRFVLEVPWTFEPATLILGALGGLGLATAVGCLGTVRLLAQKPLPVLRRE